MTEACSLMTFLLLHDPQSTLRKKELVKNVSEIGMQKEYKGSETANLGEVCVGKPAPHVEIRINPQKKERYGRRMSISSNVTATKETNPDPSDYKFLSESWIFYNAIMVREYFKDTGKDTSLVNKHLRFYARFIVVCLLLNKRKGVNELVWKFRTLVDEYNQLFQGSDGKDWTLVVQEIVRFMKADACCEVCRPLQYSILLDPHYIPEVKSPDVGKPLRLHDAILASYYHNKVKFNELTLDTFRMLQSLEWEPTGALHRLGSTESSSGLGNIGLQVLPRPSVVNKGNLHLQIPDPSLPPNPHKYILHRPTISSLLLVLAIACEELSSNSILLLYISAARSSFAGKPPRSLVAGSISALSTSGSEVNLLSPTKNAHKSRSVDPSQATGRQGKNGALPGSSSQLSSRQNSRNFGVSDSHNNGCLELSLKTEVLHYP